MQCVTALLWRRLFLGAGEEEDCISAAAAAAVLERASGLSKQLLGASEACLDRGVGVPPKSGCGKLASSGKLAQLAMLPCRPLTAQGVELGLYSECPGVVQVLHRGTSGCMRGPGYTLAGGVCTVGFNADSAWANMLRWSAVQCKSATGVTQQSPAYRLLCQATLNKML